MSRVAVEDDNDSRKYCSPCGVYKDNKWYNKKVKKMVIQQHLAPFYPAMEESDGYISVSTDDSGMYMVMTCHV